MAGEFATVLSNEILENYHKSRLNDAVNTESRYRGDLRKGKPATFREGEGKFQLKLSGMWANTMGTDGSDWPAGKDPTRIEATLTGELFLDTVTVGYKTFKAAASGKSTYYTGGILRDRIDTAVREGAKYRNIVFVGSNQGRLAVVESDGVNNFVADKDPVGIQLLKVGMTITAYNALTSGAISGSFDSQRITAIDRSTRTVTYAGTDRSLSAGDHIFAAGSYGRTPWSLFDIVDDGTNLDDPFGVSRTTYPESKATVKGNGGTLRPISDEVLLDLVSDPQQKTGMWVNKLIANDGLARRWTLQQSADRFYPQDGKSAPAYAVGYGGTRAGQTDLKVVAGGVNVNLQVEFDCPPRVLFFVPWETFGLYEAAPIDWDQEGGMLKLATAASGTGHSAQINAYLASIENVYCEAPMACSRGEDFEDPLVGDANSL